VLPWFRWQVKLPEPKTKSGTSRWSTLSPKKKPKNKLGKDTQTAWFTVRGHWNTGETLNHKNEIPTRFPLQ
jgi:hypothetical protein